MSQDEEHPEDIDFYRQKLADKDQQLSDLQSSMKKAEFKTNRQIKEAKIAEEHAKSILRDEKLKSEKLNKRVFEVEQARKLAEKKLEKAIQEKQQYERESELIKAQYKEFKNEFKRCQRILPTQVFLDSFKLTLEGINSYEELYYSLSEKVGQCNRLEDAVAKLKTLCEQTISDKEKIVAEIKLKKEEAERLFKENSEKLHELENVLSKCQRDLAERTEELGSKEQIVEQLRQKIEEYKEEMMNYERRLEQLEDKLTVEINSKEEEIRELAKTEHEKYYNQLKGLEHKYEENEKHLLANLESIEESLNTKVELSSREKEKLEQQLADARDELDQVRNKLRDESQLRNTLQKDLQKLSSVQEHELSNWSKAKQTASEEQQLLQKQLEFLKKEEQELRRKLGDAQSQLASLTNERDSTVAQLTHQVQSLQQQNESLNAEKSELEDTVRNLNDQIRQLNSRAETKATRSNSLHEIEEAMTDHSNSKESETRKRQESNGSLKFKSKTISKAENEHNEAQHHELELKLQHALAINTALQESLTASQTTQEAHKQREAVHATEKGNLERQIQEYVSLLNHHKEVAESYTRRIDELIKEEEVSKYTIKKLNEDLLEEKNVLLRSKAAFEKELQYQKELNADRDRQQEKTREKSETIIGEKKKLLAEMAKESEEKLAGIKRLKELELKLQTKDKELAEAAKEFKQKAQLTSGQIDRLQASIATSFGRQKLAAEQLKAAKSKIDELEASSAALKNQITELQLEVQNKEQQCFENKTAIDRLTKQISSLHSEKNVLLASEGGLKKQLQIERKDKAPLIRVPSLRILHEPTQGDMDNTQYLQLSEKETQIYLLNQKVGELEQEIRRLNFTQKEVKKQLEQECGDYIKQIIEMKMKVAETQMLAEQKVHHYNVMKKKYEEKFGAIK